MNKTTCRHCGRRSAGRPRGLCFRCYDCPAVRGSYPLPGSECARYGVGARAGYAGSKPASSPCPHLQGTPGRVAAMAARAAAGETLFDGRDATDREPGGRGVRA